LSSSTFPEDLQDLIRKTAIDSHSLRTVLLDFLAALDFVSVESPELLADQAVPFDVAEVRDLLRFRRGLAL